MSHPAAAAPRLKMSPGATPLIARRDAADRPGVRAGGGLLDARPSSRRLGLHRQRHVPVEAPAAAQTARVRAKDGQGARAGPHRAVRSPFGIQPARTSRPTPRRADRGGLGGRPGARSGPRRRDSRRQPCNRDSAAAARQPRSARAARSPDPRRQPGSLGPRGPPCSFDPRGRHAASTAPREKVGPARWSPRRIRRPGGRGRAGPAGRELLGAGSRPGTAGLCPDEAATVAVAVPSTPSGLASIARRRRSARARVRAPARRRRLPLAALVIFMSVVGGGLPAGLVGPLDERALPRGVGDVEPRPARSGPEPGPAGKLSRCRNRPPRAVPARAAASVASSWP